ncbi:uncharacterized protein BO66DRAFT_13902 [Aspergillus aculeatinus CBS 121060]|uniref:Uncharacterized protein n=1 Tax=Aspergillus aculeatinus CBS 121060 TaxID=1448322 RepID=A0ACD1HPW2_9EURO|nr:hypothetical protein BO66DRAFT_13902 [Aspergillus aculeatinus CBS 121060]RAH75663.1 hypothetical protein BO66DRAFT_13902 [Aspergillus aculeatinus CBS 121060]
MTDTMTLLINMNRINTMLCLGAGCLLEIVLRVACGCSCGRVGRLYCDSTPPMQSSLCWLVSCSLIMPFGAEPRSVKKHPCAVCVF